jgi:FAD/FMN-containing dehydrogenase
MVSERNEGFSSCTGGLVIDLTRMRGVDVNPEERVAHVQGGTFYADADRETQAFGLIVPAGVVSETESVLALCGGGGNFGIVTSFEFRALSLGPIVAFTGVLSRQGSTRSPSPLARLLCRCSR